MSIGSKKIIIYDNVACRLLSLLSEDEDWGGSFWNLPDLWIRHADDEGTTHQGPMEDIDNWFYARVRNRGSSSAQHFMVTFTVKPWAGTEFVYPGRLHPVHGSNRRVRIGTR
jgi:hypothetical protein